MFVWVLGSFSVSRSCYSLGKEKSRRKRHGTGPGKFFHASPEMELSPETFPTRQLKWNCRGKIIFALSRDGSLVGKVFQPGSKMGAAWENFPGLIPEWRRFQKIFRRRLWDGNSMGNISGDNSKAV